LRTPTTVAASIAAHATPRANRFFVVIIDSPFPPGDSSRRARANRAVWREITSGEGVIDYPSRN
jgi:hypothetical protein